jgi:hypothetical protein
MRIAVGVFLLVLVATPLAAQERPWYVPEGRRIELHGLSRNVSDTMGLVLGIVAPALAPGSSRAAQFQRVIAATAQTYRALKIPVTVSDSVRFIVGNDQFSARFDLGGRSLAMYLECGQDANGLWAELYKISMGLITFLTPGDGDTIELRTVLLASAVDIPRAQPDTRECRTLGSLERRIYDMTLKTLAKEGFRGAAEPD